MFASGTASLQSQIQVETWDCTGILLFFIDHSSWWFALCSLSRVHKGSIIAAISSHLGQHYLSTADGTENILYFQSNSQEGWRLGLSGGSHAWLSPRKPVLWLHWTIAVLFLNQTWMLRRPYSCLFFLPNINQSDALHALKTKYQYMMMSVALWSINQVSDLFWCCYYHHEFVVSYLVG